MREAEFKAWLQSEKYSAGTISTQMSKVRKLDRVFGDLDLLHAEGELDALEARLHRDDDLPPTLGNDGERGHLSTSLRYYRRFLEAGGKGREGQRENAMDVAGFGRWLEANYRPSTVATKLSEARQLALAYGDLDRLYDEDRLEAVRQSLVYSAADKARQKPNPSKIKLSNNIYRDLSNLRTTVNYYKRYRGEKQPKPDANAVNMAIDECAALGTATFLETYGFGENIDYWVVRDGVRYPSKAVFGVAHQFMPGGTPLDGKACNGTDARLHVEKLGFEIVAGEMLNEKEASAVHASADGATTTLNPTNLILYGPPGTGKTYATALEAVRLCGEAVPDDREELMALYRSLHQKGRIAFVTFHQNFSYEDFVEGLRPVTGTQEEGNGGNVGFSLQPHDGIFKLLANLAASNYGRAAVNDATAIDRSRKIFKMSLGRSWASEDDTIYQDAIRGGYVVLGWGGEVDWSDPRYEAWGAIKERWRQDHPTATGNDPNMSQMYTFRNNMQVGSLIVISDGNRKFRAIGEIDGPYQYVPGANGEYNHRRRVRWLWHSDESLPRELIYDKELSQVSAYQMNSRHVNWDGLEQIVAGGDAATTHGTPEPFVLIIDEINRANISKVFGELITLLEPDKRLGQQNALTVRLPYSKTEFGVPANLHIIGTMNTADRSIALLDTALRRRFRFRELAPDTTVEAFRAAVRDTDLPLDTVLDTMNDRIEYLIDREHRIGHAFFIGCRDRADVDTVMRDKVIPLLQEYFFEDWRRVAAVLGERPGKGGGFLDCRKLKDPTGHGGDDRESWSVRSAFAPDAYDRLIGKIMTVEGAEAPE